MKTVYIQHGCAERDEFEDPSIPSGSNAHWIPWLQKQLMIEGYNCQTPEMPRPYGPSFNRWKSLFSIYPLNQKTTLVGHSCGCGFFLKYLSQTDHKIDKLILVAPWLDPKRIMGSFLDCELAPDLADRVNELYVLFSRDEPVEGVEQTVDLIRETYPSHNYHEFKDHGHFTQGEMGTDAFPELLKMIL